MATRKQALRSLKVDDIFLGHAFKSEAVLNCIITHVDENWIEARRMTTQQDHRFNRETGVSDCGSYIIDCVEPLPIDIQKVWRALDERYRAKGNPALSEEEIKAFIFTDEFQAAHPI